MNYIRFYRYLLCGRCKKIVTFSVKMHTGCQTVARMHVFVTVKRYTELRKAWRKEKNCIIMKKRLQFSPPLSREGAVCQWHTFSADRNGV